MLKAPKIDRHEFGPDFLGSPGPRKFEWQITSSGNKSALANVLSNNMAEIENICFITVENYFSFRYWKTFPERLTQCLTIEYYSRLLKIEDRKSFLLY